MGRNRDRDTERGIEGRVSGGGEDGERREEGEGEGGGDNKEREETINLHRENIIIIYL